jgi:hypothetical protein
VLVLYCRPGMKCEFEASPCSVITHNFDVYSFSTISDCSRKHRCKAAEKVYTLFCLKSGKTHLKFWHQRLVWNHQYLTFIFLLYSDLLYLLIVGAERVIFTIIDTPWHTHKHTQQTHIHTQTNIHKHTNTHTHTHTHANKHTYTQKRTYINIQTHTHTHTHANKHTYTQSVWPL